jgi:hypothetical protein
VLGRSIFLYGAYVLFARRSTRRLVSSEAQSGNRKQQRSDNCWDLSGRHLSAPPTLDDCRNRFASGSFNKIASGCAKHAALPTHVEQLSRYVLAHVPRPALGTVEGDSD